jgi:SagB-type dehydrogenase family enzyme
MEPFLYSYFHEKTNDRSEDGLVSIPKDRETWPDNWKNYEYKEYSRLQGIALPKSPEVSALMTLVEKRTGAVSRIHEQKIEMHNLAACLAAGYGTLSRDGEAHKPVPSGGARYPLELYVAVWGEVADVPRGYYHYNANAHSLSKLPFTALTKNDVAHFSKDEWVREAHGAIIISAVFNRTVRKYGSRGYRYILLEAGHVGQNICLAGAEQGLAIRPLGSFTEEYFENILQFDVINERIVYAIVF